MSDANGFTDIGKMYTGMHGCWVGNDGMIVRTFSHDDARHADTLEVRKLTDPAPERRKLLVSAWKQRRASNMADRGYDRAVRNTRKRT